MFSKRKLFCLQCMSLAELQRAAVVHSCLTNFNASSNLVKMNDVRFFFLMQQFFSFPSSRIKLSSFWEEKEEEKIQKEKTANEVAHSAGLLDQFPSAPCGGFHLQENWNWQDPVFSAIYLKSCTHLDTLWFPRTMWRLSFAYWYMACILFSLLCLILFDFPLLHSISVKGFYAFTSHVLNTLRQHIWCSHLLCNVCTWKSHSGMKQSVFSLRTEYILQPPGRTFLLLKQTPCSDWLDTMVPDSRARRPVAYLRRHLEMWGFLFLLELSPHL